MGLITYPQTWIGIDLDGTLAEYDTWRGIEHIGEPVPKMLERVRKYLQDGENVRIFTARVFPEHIRGVTLESYSREGVIQFKKFYADSPDMVKLADARLAFFYIQEWCEYFLYCKLPITCTKDPGMVLLLDDRCLQVVPNTGVIVGE